MEIINKIGIMSDSHDNMPAIRAAVELFNKEKVDLVIHAGDIVAPFTAKEIKKLACPYRMIFGNNDGEILGLHKIYEGNIFQPPHSMKINDKKLLVLHEPTLVNELKNSGNFDYIIYGHDHASFAEHVPNGTIVINPGECGGWLTGKSTVAILNVANSEVKILELTLTKQG